MSKASTPISWADSRSGINLEEVAARNPNVDLALLRRGQELIDKVGRKPHRGYNIDPPFSRRGKNPP